MAFMEKKFHPAPAFHSLPVVASAGGRRKGFHQSTPSETTPKKLQSSSHQPVAEHAASIFDSSTSVNDKPQPEHWSDLELVGLGLRNLSPTLFVHFQFLTALHLNGNNLTSISSEIALLRNLKHLNISDNHLKSVPPEIGKLVQLREFLMYNNFVNLLPVEFGSLYQLEVFGLDGNPLVEPLYSMNATSGGLSLVSFLRDNNTMMAPPVERSWISLPSFTEETLSSDCISVVSFNILSERYSTPQRYGYVPSWALEWKYRRELILQELASYSADIICLQEMEGAAYEEFFYPQMKERFGYESVFVQKSRCKTMNDKERRTVDGCATFYRPNRFRLEESTLLEFSQLAAHSPEITQSEKIYQRLALKDNICLVTRFLDLASIEPRQLLVANVHIHWNPDYPDVKLMQAILLVEEVTRLAKACGRVQPHVLLMGDFNSTPDSGVYTFLGQGTIPAHHADFLDLPYGKYADQGAAHRLSLCSVLSLTPETSSMETSVVPWFKGHIDYIWYRQDTGLVPTGVLGPLSKEYQGRIVGLPTQHLPSDHLPVMAEFRISAPVPPPNHRFPPAHAESRRIVNVPLSFSFGNHRS